MIRVLIGVCFNRHSHENRGSRSWRRFDLERRANEQGNLFGSVTATDVSKGLQAQNFNIEPGDVNLPGKLDQVRDYTVTIRFAEDLSADIKVWVHADAESKAAMEAYAKNRAAQEAPAEA